MLKGLKAMVANFNIQMYQTKEVADLCNQLLIAGGYDYTILLKEVEDI
jgi:hypothetical protein